MHDVLALVFSSVWTFAGSFLMLLIVCAALTKARLFEITIEQGRYTSTLHEVDKKTIDPSDL